MLFLYIEVGDYHSPTFEIRCSLKVNILTWSSVIKSQWNILDVFSIKEVELKNLCPPCKEEQEETIFHKFYDCSFAQQF